MGKRSPIAQKVEKNRRIAAREKFENIARVVVGEPHRFPDYEQKLNDVELITVRNGHIIKSESDESRRIMYANTAPSKNLTRKKIVKWGKKYWATYDGAEIVKLERIRG